MQHTLPNLQIHLKPGCIDLAWGHPDHTLLPVELMAQASADALRRWGSQPLQYGYAYGPGPLVAWLIARVKHNEGLTPAPGEIMVTGGNSLALDQLLTLHTVPGDIVLVESPTYYIALNILRDHHLHIVSVPADDDGLDTEALSAILAQLQVDGKQARALYCVPTFNNPSGVSLSLARRKRLLQLAASHDFLVIEDDVYRELAYDGPALPSLWALAQIPEGLKPADVRVARLGSFAKTLAPGLRLGYMTAPASIVKRLTDGGVLFSGGGGNHFTAFVVAALCESGGYDIQLTKFKTAYSARRNAMLAALKQYLPANCRWVAPGGGFFVWLRLPVGVDTRSLLPKAERLGVGFVPGSKFTADGQMTNALRLSFSLFAPEQIEEGVRRLATLLSDSA